MYKFTTTKGTFIIPASSYLMEKKGNYYNLSFLNDSGERIFLKDFNTTTIENIQKDCFFSLEDESGIVEKHECTCKKPLTKIEKIKLWLINFSKSLGFLLLLISTNVYGQTYSFEYDKFYEYGEVLTEYTVNFTNSNIKSLTGIIEVGETLNFYENDLKSYKNFIILEEKDNIIVSQKLNTLIIFNRTNSEVYIKDEDTLTFFNVEEEKVLKCIDITNIAEFLTTIKTWN